MADYLQQLQRLEDFFSSPKFTDAVSDFFQEHCSQLEFKPIDQEQPMKNYDIFNKYTTMIEQQLEAFVAEEGLTNQDIFAACQKAQASGELQHITCIDYLLASTEYESFMELAEDFHSLSAYDPTNDAEAWDAPPDDEEDNGAVVPLDQEEEVDIRGD